MNIEINHSSTESKVTLKDDYGYIFGHKYFVSRTHKSKATQAYEELSERLSNYGIAAAIESWEKIPAFN